MTINKQITSKLISFQKSHTSWFILQIKSINTTKMILLLNLKKQNCLKNRNVDWLLDFYLIYLIFIHKHNKQYFSTLHLLINN